MQIRYFDAVSSDEFTIAKGIPKNESPKICDFSIRQIMITRREKREEKNVKCEICRLSPQEFPIEYLIAKVGFDTAENGPFKV